MNAPEAVARVDRALGEGIERLVVAHHRRRLAKLGRPVTYHTRTGNALEVLVDGADALPRMVDAIASATSTVLVAGWHVAPSFRLAPDGPTVRELLASAAPDVDVRVIVWAGAPLPLFHPSRAEVRESCAELARGTRIRVARDSRERPMHCHHEKVVLVDDRIAYVGGIDLTDLAGDRLDTSGHPTRPGVGWHDAAVRVEGPLVADVAEHLRMRWHEVTGEEFGAVPEQQRAGDVEARLARTIPERIYDAVPRGDFGILDAYIAALTRAERLVYLESQFLWSPEIVAILAEKLRRPPVDEFRVVLVLPSRANNGEDDTRGQLGALVEADADAGRLLACTLYQPGGDPVYVHAKVGVVDDRWLTVGSANLNEHSLFNDTELNVVTEDAGLARATRLRLWREHLERDDVDGPAHEVVDELWKPVAEEQYERRRRGEPQTHRLARLPHVSRRSRRLLGPVQSLLVDG